MIIISSYMIVSLAAFYVFWYDFLHLLGLCVVFAMNWIVCEIIVVVQLRIVSFLWWIILSQLSNVPTKFPFYTDADINIMMWWDVDEYIQYHPES